MATKKQIDANRRNSQNSPGPTDTTKTRHNATTHSLYSAGITDLDRAEGLEVLFASLIAEHNPVGVLENFHVYCMARSIIREIRIHRLESQFLERVLQPEFRDNRTDGNSASEPKRPTVNFRVPSQVAPSLLETLVTRYNRCEAFYSNHLFRSERDLERLQRIRNGEQLPAPVEVGVTVHSDPEKLESLRNVKNNTWVSPWPATISNGSGATKDSAPNTDEPAGHVSVPLEPDARRTELARTGEEDSVRVSPLPEAVITLANGATQDSRCKTEELCSKKATGDLGVVAGAQNVLSHQKPCPRALWQKIPAVPHWMKENETKPKS